uniref:urease subunit beta n=1 Tax=Alistipes sp. TaxID=1872444 RepID=UPI004056FA3C
MNQRKESTKSKLYPMEQGFMPKHEVKVGGVLLSSAPICYNEDRATCRIEVSNTGDRPVQVGSHFHFFEVNRALKFDRAKAFGCHLNIPATTAIRFEPGDRREVELVRFGGKQRIVGFNGLVQGYSGEEDSPAYYPIRERALKRLRKRGFADGQVHAEESSKGDSTKNDSPKQNKKE